MWRSERWDVSGPGIVRALRASLEDVSEEDKAPLIARLGELEECAAEVTSTPVGKALLEIFIAWSTESTASTPPVTTQTPPAKPTASTGGESVVGGRTSGDRPPERSARRKAGESPSPRTLLERRFSGGIEGGRQHPSPGATLNVACAGLSTITVESQPSAEPPKPPLGPTVWNSVHRAVAGNILGPRSMVSRSDCQSQTTPIPSPRYRCSLVSVKKPSENASSSKPTTSPSGPKVKEVGPE